MGDQRRTLSLSHSRPGAKPGRSEGTRNLQVPQKTEGTAAVGWSERSASSCRRYWAGGDEPLPTTIDRQIEPLERPCSQQQQVPRLGKHYFINCKLFVHPENRKTDAAGDYLSVCHHKSDIFLLSAYADSFQLGSRNPRVLAAGIH